MARDYHARDWCPTPARIVTDSDSAHSPCVAEIQNAPISGSFPSPGSEVLAHDTAVITLTQAIDLSLGVEVEVAVTDVPIGWRFYNSIYINGSYLDTIESVNAPSNATEGVESFWWDLDSTVEVIASNVSTFGIQPGDISGTVNIGDELTIRTGLASSGSPPLGWSPEVRIDRYRFFSQPVGGIAWFSDSSWWGL